MRIYLDTCVYGRPFDDQSHERIRREALAFLAILTEVVAGRLILVGSDVLSLEVGRNPSVVHRDRIRTFLGLCSEVVTESQEVLDLARRLQSLSLRPRDALHIASAAIGTAEYLLTCDDGVVKKGPAISCLLTAEGRCLQVLDPIAFQAKL